MKVIFSLPISIDSFEKRILTVVVRLPGSQSTGYDSIGNNHMSW